MSSLAFPFLRLRDTAVTASSWLVSVEGGPDELLGRELPRWDYAATLDLARTLQVDFNEAASQLAMDVNGLRFAMIITLGTGGARLPRFRQPVWRQTVSANGSPITVRFQVNSAHLSQRLILATDILILDAPRSSSRLSPQHPATRMWGDEHLTHIEPHDTRFPIEVISFSRLLRDQAPDALWFLEWSSNDLGRDFMTAVRLYINADNSAFVARVRESDAVTLQLLMSAIVVQMARATIREEAFDLDMVRLAPGSVGAIVANWIQAAFPNQSLSTIRTRAEHAPAAFEAALSSIASNS